MVFARNVLQSKWEHLKKKIDSVFLLTRHLFLSSHVSLFLFQPMLTPAQFLWLCISISVKQKICDYISIGFQIRSLFYKFNEIRICLDLS